jgi:RNA polymerase sigma factor for flagellar operon FliA
MTRNRNKNVEAPPSWWNDLLYGTTEDSHRARESLILHYQFLVEAMARKLKTRLPSWINDEDLISYGQIGLIRAVDRYDPTIGPFRSFASTYVHGAIMDELRAQDWAPRGLRRDQQMIHKATLSLKSEEKVPSSSNIAQELGWTDQKFSNTVKKIDNARPTSLEIIHDFHHEDDIESTVTAHLLCSLFAKMFSDLPEESQLVLARRYYLQETMAAVSENTGLPAAIVREIHAVTISSIYEKIYQTVS